MAPSLNTSARNRRENSGSLGNLLLLAYPLILATSGHGLRMFCDRAMLTNYSGDAIKACLQAGATAFTIGCFFQAIIFYSSTFVSQYDGAQRKKRIGQITALAIIFAIISGALLPFASLFARPFFEMIGGEPGVIDQKVKYFTIINSYSFSFLLCTAFSAFWGGRGRTRTIMFVEFTMVLVNIFVNWLLIFGKFGLPEMGIAGAAYGTVGSTFSGVLVYAAMYFSKRNRKKYGTIPEKWFDVPQAKRLLRFGLPIGLQQFLDVACFTILVHVLEQVGPRAHLASNWTFTLNLLAFLPMIGMAASVRIVVGQSIGDDINRREREGNDVKTVGVANAKRAIRNSLRISIFYAGLMALLFTLAPSIPLFFVENSDPEQLAAIPLTKQLLYFLATYLFFQAVLCTFRASLNGAGDTRWAMFAAILLGWCTLAIPAMIALHFIKAYDVSQNHGACILWGIFVAHVGLAGLVFFLRYRGGKWQKMQVIETVVTGEAPPPQLPVIPPPPHLPDEEL